MERLGYSKDYINAVKGTIDVRDLYERTLASGPAVSTSAADGSSADEQGEDDAQVSGSIPFAVCAC